MVIRADSATLHALGRRFRHAGRALHYRDYRLYFLGQSVSTLGKWLQQIALGWLVYRLTGSVVLLGVTAFLSQIPQLLVGPLAGAVIDRSNIRALMLLVQMGMLLLSAVLSVITHFHWVLPWHVLCAAAVFGVLNSFDVPLRHAYASQLVPHRQDLPNAVALNSLFFNMARFVGPPLAGLVLTISSEAVCFGLNALSFMGIIGVLLRLKTESRPHSAASFRVVVREGFGFIRYSFPVRHLLLQVAMLNLLAASYTPLMPAFVRQVFQGGPDTLGWLLGSAGAGALCASLLLASRWSVIGLAGSIANGNLVVGFSLLGFSLSHDAWFAALMLFLTGFGLINGNASSNTILQTIVPENLRGRVLAVYSAAAVGGAALGGLFSGLLAGFSGPDGALSWMGGLLILVSIYFRIRLELLRMYLRPLYAALGIERRESA